MTIYNYYILRIIYKLEIILTEMLLLRKISLTMSLLL